MTTYEVPVPDYAKCDRLGCGNQGTRWFHQTCVIVCNDPQCWEFFRSDLEAHLREIVNLPIRVRER